VVVKTDVKSDVKTRPLKMCVVINLANESAGMVFIILIVESAVRRNAALVGAKNVTRLSASNESKLKLDEF
jgi:hypothetical protein